eukprot:199663_1
MMLKYCKYEDNFVEALQEYVQEKSSSKINKLLKRNKNEWKHEIPQGMISLAVCTTTIRNKIEMNESPVKTLEVLTDWNCDLNEDECRSFRLMLYEFYTLDDDQSLLNASFDIIEYYLYQTSIEIQEFDCHGLDEDESLLMVSCARWVDHSINKSFNTINELRATKLEKLSIFLFNHCNLEQPYNKIIAQYVWGGKYIFHFDENEYNHMTGEYKDKCQSDEST